MASISTSSSSPLSYSLTLKTQLLPNPPPIQILRFSAHHSKNYRITDESNPRVRVSTCCFHGSNDIHSSSSSKNAASIGVATAASKILGLIREVTLASFFGMGPEITAYKKDVIAVLHRDGAKSFLEGQHASLLPGFFMSVLGGVNGPIHLTMATTLSKLPKERGKKLIQNTNSLMFLIGGSLGALIFIFAESIIYASAPGLWVSAKGGISKGIAISQLKLMIPCVILSGPVGLGLGYLSAEGDNFLACICPALSSILVIASCAIYALMRESNTYYLKGALFGGMMISCGASLGAFCQWLMQVVVQVKRRDNSISVSWLNILKDKDVHEFLILMLPAILGSGMGQIASFTDLYFASYIPSAAACLSYAHLIAMAPLGLLSSVILLPLLPTFSELAKPLTFPSLMKKLKQTVVLCMVIVLPILSTMCVLAEPALSIFFQWSTSDCTASAMVSSLLLCYSLGSPFYIIRELLVMVFYALGDGRQPFVISMVAIILNAFLDWLFVSKFSLGAQGLALSTSLVSSLSVLALFHLLSRKLRGVVDAMVLFGPFLLLVVCSIISGCNTLIVYNTLRHMASQVSFIRSFTSLPNRFSTMAELLVILLSGLLGICSFFLLAFRHFPELKRKNLFKQLLNR